MKNPWTPWVIFFAIATAGIFLAPATSCNMGDGIEAPDGRCHLVSLTTPGGRGATVSAKKIRHDGVGRVMAWDLTKYGRVVKPGPVQLTSVDMVIQEGPCR